MADQPNAAQDKRTHDDFGDIGLPRRHVFEIRASDTQYTTFHVSAGTNQILPAAEEVQFSGKLTCDKQHNALGVTSGLERHDLYFTFKDHKEVNVSIPSCEKGHAFCDYLLFAEGMEPVQHLRGEPRECFSLTFIGIGEIQVD